jgi:hypothetical protein
MVQRVTDRLGRRPAGGQFGKLRLEPDTQLGNQRLALELTHGLSISGGLAADIHFDRVECGNPLQCFDRDRRLRLGQVIEAAAHVAPAERERDGRIGGLGSGELLVGRVAVALEDAAVAAEQSVGVGVSAARRVAVDHGRRLIAGPRPIVARNRPEVPLLGFAPARVQHWHDGLISEDPCRSQHHLAQPGYHGGNLGRGIPHPEGQRGPLDDHTLAL